MKNNLEICGTKKFPSKNNKNTVSDYFEMSISLFAAFLFFQVEEIKIADVSKIYTRNKVRKYAHFRFFELRRR